MPGDLELLPPTNLGARTSTSDIQEKEGVGAWGVGDGYVYVRRRDQLCVPGIGTHYFNERKGQRTAMGAPWWQAWVVLPWLERNEK